MRTPKRRKTAHDTSTPCPATQHDDPFTTTATPSPVLGKHAADFPIACELFGPAFDPSDPIARQKIHGLILEALRMEGDGDHITVVRPSNGQRTNLVRVPQFATDKSFKRRAKALIEPIITNSSYNDDSGFEAARRITDYLVTNYKGSVMASLEKHPDIPICTPMSATAYVSMLQAARVNTTQEKELSKHLRDHLGNAFCPT